MKNKNVKLLGDIIKDIIFFENHSISDDVVFVPKSKINIWQRELFYLLADEIEDEAKEGIIYHEED